MNVDRVLIGNDVETNTWRVGKKQNMMDIGETG